MSFGLQKLCFILHWFREHCCHFYWLCSLILLCTLRLGNQKLSTKRYQMFLSGYIWRTQFAVWSAIINHEICPEQSSVLSSDWDDGIWALFTVTKLAQYQGEPRTQQCTTEPFQNKHHSDWPGRGTEARLLTSVCLMACRRRCRACVRISSWPNSASRRSLALNISAMCFCRMVFCSSNSTLALRSRRSSASRAVRENKTFCKKNLELQV